MELLRRLPVDVIPEAYLLHLTKPEAIQEVILEYLDILAKGAG